MNCPQSSFLDSLVACYRGNIARATIVVAASVMMAAAQDQPKSNGLPFDPATQQDIDQAAAPAEIKRLIEDGRVSVVYDSDLEFRKAGRGWADFYWQVDRTFQYQAVISVRNGKRIAKVSITKIEPTLELKHLVRLPVQFRSGRVWESRLLRHEFDHVAVSLDPRPRLLLLHLLKNLPVLEIWLSPVDQLSEKHINELINAAIDDRVAAVVELVKENNRHLDKIAQNGVIAVPERSKFFAELYEKENLVERKFAFVNSVVELLKSREYEQSKPRQLSRDPVETR